MNISGQCNKETIKSILSSFNYEVKDAGSYLQTQAKWRNGNDVQSVTVYPSDNVCKDWVVGETFNINELLLRVMGAKTQEELDKIVGDRNIVISEPDNSPKIKQAKVFDKSLLSYIDKTDNSYLIGRGISEETCRLFECGKVGEVRGKLKNRFCWPIWDTQKKELQGFSGRSLQKDCDKFKYIIFGDKKNFVYPSHLNDDIIGKTKCVLLTEGVPDIMRLFDIGLKNCLSLFGTELSYGILNYLLRKNVEKIVIVTNNELDSKNGGAGNISAKKIKSRLIRYFDQKSVIEHLPPKKDIMDCNREELQKWTDELQMKVGYEYFNY